MKRLTVFALALFTVAALTFAACGGDASTEVAPGEEPLSVARIDLSQRLRLDALHIQISRVQLVGWNSCLGVFPRDGMGCDDIGISGLIAWFRVDGRDQLFRYHLSSRTIIATDFISSGATISDGNQRGYDDAKAIHARLADYARDDLALRLAIDRSDAFVADIIPALFNDGCLGFAHADNRSCDTAITPGAIVLLEAANQLYTYHVAEVGFVATDFEEGIVTQSPDTLFAAVELEMRTDMAKRLLIPTEEISFLSFDEVTWPSGCLGIHREDQACTQALVDGFVADLTDGNQVYRYHGSGNQFILATCEDETVLSIIDPRGMVNVCRPPSSAQ